MSAGAALNEIRRQEAAWQGIGRSSAAVLDPAVLEDICGGDDAFRSELLERFEESCALLLARLDDAARAGDAALLGETAHRLKGAALTIGANAFAATLLEIERHGDAGDAARAGHGLLPARVACGTLREHLNGAASRSH